MGYRIRHLAQTRAKWAKMMQEAGEGPTLVCLNHLTRIDSLIFQFAFMNPWKFAFNYRYLPWHVLELANIAFGPVRLLCYLIKTIPIVRMGNRHQIRSVEERVKTLLLQGDFVLIFPEGKRSATGRVDTVEFQYGIGNILRDLPTCRVLCGYLRAENQKTKSNLPPFGSVIDVSFTLLHPKSELSGLRAARDLANQVVNKLADMENTYFEQSLDRK